MLLRGGLRIFQLFGIQVYLHWTWLVAAFLLINVQYSNNAARSATFYILQLATIFLIVLLHEFGHALACKSVGGTAKEIILTPLGGIAFAKPPARPGATLWTIAAGPLVNVLFIPITAVAYFVANMTGGPLLTEFTYSIMIVNIIMLIFNLLPIYPLDGGQILQSLLWFVFGQWRALQIAAAIGVAGAAVLVALGLLSSFVGGGGFWLIIVGVFMGMQAFGSLGFANARMRLDKLPKRMDAACPHCKAHPPLAPVWPCRCGARFDLFATYGICPRCHTNYQEALCLACFKESPTRAWYAVRPTAEEPAPSTPPRLPVVINLPPNTPLPWRPSTQP